MDLFSRRTVGWHLADGMTESRRPVCRQRISICTASRRGTPKYEPCGRLLRQRIHGKLFRNDQDGTRNDRLPKYSASQKRDRSIRPLLQFRTPTSRHRLLHTSSVRTDHQSQRIREWPVPETVTTSLDVWRAKGCAKTME